jgi:hypothetical protein
MQFPNGTVGDTLERMRGVWHDHVEVFDLDGTPLDRDADSGTPGAAPYDNLVYVDFDGDRYRQTNVCFRGRPLHSRTFTGTLRDGVLVFDRLGPDAPTHIGASGGPGVLFFATSEIGDASRRYSEPDCVRLLSSTRRTRTTLLYRGGTAVRTLTANGRRIALRADRRVPWDPRGAAGEAHEPAADTQVFRRAQ